jgi:serine/threonine-protein kinase
LVTASKTHTFGEYELIRKLATGGMADVWLAKQHGASGFSKTMVIKMIREKLSTDDDFVRLFIDEARIAVELMHPNIVQVYDLNSINKQYYMAMEYVDGLDLARLITRGRQIEPFPIHLGLLIINNILQALQCAHTKKDFNGQPLNISHCDISPQNILISHAGEVKLTDFGISRAAFQSKKLQQAVRGKYAYMSPEQIAGKSLDATTDLFSLGIVLYELLSGRRLFKGKDKQETLNRVRAAKVPDIALYRPDSPKGLQALLQRALAPKVKNRLQSATQFLEELNVIMMSNNFRASNLDLAEYVSRIVKRDTPKQASSPVASGAVPTTVVVLAIEAAPPLVTLANPKQTVESLTNDWVKIIQEHEGDIWEREDASMLIVWNGSSDLPWVVSQAAKTARALTNRAQQEGFTTAAGIAPGTVKLQGEKLQPLAGWQLDGPFYLSRWMMNQSTRRGRLLLTEVAHKHADIQTSTPLGKIRIQGDQFITIFEAS